jgi:hypothetical protein
MSFDVVIPLGSKDEDIIGRCVNSVREFIIGVREIHIVSQNEIQVDGATVHSEAVFPFQKTDVEMYVKQDRAGWYLQQLIKLYAPLVIPNLLENVLIVDADTIFFRKIRFIQNGIWYYDSNTFIHKPYFESMVKLHPSFKVWKPKTSGIVNVMIFNRDVLKEIMNLVEEYHKEEFWKSFLKTSEKESISGASEYEIYFHYVMRKYPSRVKIRHLQYDNFGQRNNIQSNGYDYISYHWHVQKDRKM